MTRLVVLCAVVCAAASAVMRGAQADAPTLAITSPLPEAVVTGRVKVEAVLSSPDVGAHVSVSVDGRLLCSIEAPPYACDWDAGPAVREHHVRVVAYLGDGSRLVANVRTKDLGYTERVDVDAVQVPVVVMKGGTFVRGLKAADFTVLEDGIPQRIESLVSEDTPLDLVLAIDVSGSMYGALPDVKAAVKQLLARLRTGDAATLVGFNETTFTVAERQTDQRAREAAVDLLASWGGTALYDATIKALDLVRRERGRKGVVIFSDGDDHDSVASVETAMARVQASNAMLFTVAFGRGGTVPALRKGLERYAKASGGRAYFAEDVRDLGRVFGEIVENLANQYMLSYTPPHPERDGRWHALEVRVRGGRYEVRAREGYRAAARRGRGGER